MLLGTDVGESYTGILNAHDLVHIYRTHKRELLQHLWTHVGVDTAVYEHELACHIRDNGRKRYTLNALDTLDYEHRARADSAGVARGEERVARALLEQSEAYG